MKKAKIGRPKLPKGEAKKPFPMRFSDSELAALKNKADARGMGVREWITVTLTNAVE